MTSNFADVTQVLVTFELDWALCDLDVLCHLAHPSLRQGCKRAQLAITMMMLLLFHVKTHADEN